MFLSRFVIYDASLQVNVLLQGGEQVELIPGGSDIEVTASNVYDYVRRYAEYRMVDSAEKCLQVNFSFTVKCQISDSHCNACNNVCVYIYIYIYICICIYSFMNFINVSQ